MKHHKIKNGLVKLAGPESISGFFELVFSDRNQELMVVAFCDDKLTLVELLSFPGHETKVQASIRDIFRCAFEYTAFIVAHNHPSGDPQPSAADTIFTKRLVLVAEALNVTFVDHLIFAQGGMFSFRRMGLI